VTSRSVTFSVRVTPRAGRDEVTGVDEGGVLRVRLAAAPVDGAANRALLRTLAHELGTAPSALEVVRGEHARVKRVRVHGVDAARLTARWAGLHVPPSPGSEGG
jgi:uncharacterized protein (TIGR00251 family)